MPKTLLPVLLLFTAADCLAVNPVTFVNQDPRPPESDFLTALLNEQLDRQPNAATPNLPSPAEEQESREELIRRELETYVDDWDQNIVERIQAERSRMLAPPENPAPRSPELHPINNYNDALIWLTNFTTGTRELQDQAAAADSSNYSNNNIEIPLPLLLDLITQIHNEFLPLPSVTIQLVDELRIILRQYGRAIYCNREKSDIPEALRRLHNQAQGAQEKIDQDRLFYLDLNRLLEAIFVDVQGTILLRANPQPVEDTERDYAFVRDMALIFVTVLHRLHKADSRALINSHIHSLHASRTEGEIPATARITFIAHCLTINLAFSGVSYPSIPRQNNDYSDIFTSSLYTGFSRLDTFVNNHPNYKYWVGHTIRRLIHPSASAIASDYLPPGQIVRAQTMFAQFFPDNFGDDPQEPMESLYGWLMWCKEHAIIEYEQIEHYVTSEYRHVESIQREKRTPQQVLAEVLCRIEWKQNMSD